MGCLLQTKIEIESHRTVHGNAGRERRQRGIKSVIRSASSHMAAIAVANFAISALHLCSDMVALAHVA